MITLPFPSRIQVLAFGETSYVTNEQLERNEGMLFDGSIYFRRTVKGVPKRAVVSFAHFGGHAGFQAPYSVLDASKIGLDNTLYLSLQDPFFIQGSYLLSDNFGNDPKPRIAKTISNELKAFGLTAAETTFLGSSKGAATALIMAQVFPPKTLLLCSLTTDLNGPIRNSRYSHLGVALDYYGVGYPDTAELLFATAESKDVHWLYSTKDATSTRGNEKKSAAKLHKYAFDQSHGEIIGNNFEFMAKIILSAEETES